MNQNDPIANALGMNPLLKTTNPVVPQEFLNEDDSTKADIETARNNVHKIISITDDAISEIADIASSSEHPKAYDSLNSLLKTALDANRTLVDMQKIRKDIETPKENTTNVTNNNLVISTKDLLNMLRNKEE